MSRSPARLLPPLGGGSGGSRHTAYSVITRATESTRYKVDKPTIGSRAPADNGPRTEPNVKTVVFNASADGIRSGGTSRAMAALRVGMFTAKNDCCRPSSTSTTHTESTCVAACAHSSTELSATPELVISRSLRRSIMSAMAPPQRPNTSNGTSATAPVRPTNPDEPVRSNTCLGTATAVSCDPSDVTAVDSHNLRNGTTRRG